MVRSVEPTLLSLLPTFPSAASLPRSLIDLAGSLLAQSRQNASVLKTEEEVARLYACAHIACERLKTTLDLPPIQPRPPVPPRIYKRLYTHLDHILPQSSVGRSGRIRTPSRALRESLLDNGSVQRSRERPTPSKEASLAQFRSPSGTGSHTPSRSRGSATPSSVKQKRQEQQGKLPSWIRPTIQSLCTQLDNARIGRTVLAGMHTIVVPYDKRTRDEWVNSHLTPLVAAVYFIVATQVIVLETEKEFDSKQYLNLRRQILKAIQKARAEVEVEVEVKGIEDPEEAWDGWTDITSKDIDKAMDKVAGSQWQEEEWFTGIAELVRESNTGDDEDHEMVDAPDIEDGSERLSQQRGDSMFQGRWVMTDRKRAEYQAWKESILRRCEMIENAKEAGNDVHVSA